MMAHKRFQPLSQSDFQGLKQAGYLKGPLKPFKGKSDMSIWQGLCEQYRSDLIDMARMIAQQSHTYPFSLLPARLTLQNTSAGTSFLRWRNQDRTLMGVELWQDMVEDMRTPPNLLEDLYNMEIQRITLNMQISIVHTMANQARQCAEKMRQAEMHYQKRFTGENT